MCSPCVQRITSEGEFYRETVVMSPVDVESSAPASTGPTAAGNERKRPRLDLNAEPRKKGRSIFGQVFGTLKKARDEDSKLKTSDAVSIFLAPSPH